MTNEVMAGQQYAVEGHGYLVPKDGGDYVLASDYDALRASHERLQAVVNAASLWEQSFSSEVVDDENVETSEEHWENELSLMDAVKAYRAALAKASGV